MSEGGAGNARRGFIGCAHYLSRSGFDRPSELALLVSPISGCYSSSCRAERARPPESMEDPARHGAAFVDLAHRRTAAARRLTRQRSQTPACAVGFL
jgi:hypothetical protein